MCIFCFKKVGAFLFSLLINATCLMTFISFASLLCIGDRWLTIPSVYFSIWVSDGIYRLPAVLGSQIFWVSSWGYFREWNLLSSLFLNSVIFSSLWCSSSVKQGVLHIAHSFCEFWYLHCQKQRLSWGLLGSFKSERCVNTYVSFYHRGVINTNEHLRP